MAAETEGNDDIALAEKLRSGLGHVRRELARRVVGQEEALDQVLLTLLVGGNSIITGVPGLAKTLIVHTMAQTLDLKFSRIQFTPDLMPSDITGTDIIQEDAEGRRSLVFVPGPVFANVVLADEINRTPPKTQAALLEAMQEQRVTVQGRTFTLAPPFFVFATQNPIELEGTYPLPEAQLDRFMFDIVIDHLPEDQEMEVIRRTTVTDTLSFIPTLGAADIVEFQKLVRRVPVADDLIRYAVRLVRMTRPGETSALDFVKNWVEYGASVRAAQYLVLGGKARALMRGHAHVGFDDIRSLAKPVLRHRLLRTFAAESGRVTTDTIVDRVLERVTPPPSNLG
jgi:MoxR-like ATPase